MGEQESEAARLLRSKRDHNEVVSTNQRTGLEKRGKPILAARRDLPCTCGRVDGTHHYNCSIRRAERRRK